MIAYDKERWRSAVRNGQIPLHMLDEVYPTQYDRDLNGPARAHPEAAAAMSTMLQAAAEQGFPDLGIALSYRTLAMQEEKWDNYQNHGGNKAATPGTSNHGWAVAFDMNWGRWVTHEWLVNNARKYGFIFDVTGENWHITYQEGLWDGDDVTEAQLKMLLGLRDDTLELQQFRNGMIALDEKWTVAASNPIAPKDRDTMWKRGFNILKRAYNRPKEGGE